MSAERLRITWVLPSFSPTGGAQVVYRHAAWARARGHHVTVLGARVAISPLWHGGHVVTLKRWLYNRFWDRATDVRARYGVQSYAREVPQVKDRTVPPADVIVATSFETAEWIAALADRAGARAYFLQDYEAWTADLEPRVDATWRMPFARLAVSRWLMSLGRERLRVECRGPIGNGVDSDRFRPLEQKPQGSPVTVGAIYDRRPGKAHEVLLAALGIIADRRPDTTFLLFGRTRLHHRLPARARYVWNPSWERVPGLYREMDIFLHASTREGWGMPPMEAMASGCALVSTPAGGVPEFADEGCARLVPAGDAEALAGAALELAEHRDEREELAASGRVRMLGETWACACTRMESELVRIARREGAS